MKWLLLWLFEDLRRLLDPHARELDLLRDGILRARSRHARHSDLAKEALKRTGELLRRVRALEISRDAPVETLVEVRRALLLAEGDLRHHHARAAQAEEALRLMREDRRHMESGRDAAHRERYAEFLNA